MSRESAHETLYTMVADMVKTNVKHAFNFNWEPRYDKDNTHGAKPNGPAFITIELLDETNVDDAGGLGSGEYFDTVQVKMYCTVAMSTADVKNGSVGRYQDKEINKAIDDVKARFSYPWALSADGVHTLKYTGCQIADIKPADKYTTKRLTCSFDMKYRTNRTLMD